MAMLLAATLGVDNEHTCITYFIQYWPHLDTLQCTHTAAA